MTWSDQLKTEATRRIVGESIPRAIQCLGMLTETQIWHRPNGVSNSVGNLVLHCCGNARQWMLSTMGGQEDRRERDEEFEEQGPLPTAELVSLLKALAIELEQMISEVTPEKMTQSYRVQGFDETGIGILIHVAEHFSYHVGQITYVTKAMTGKSTGYYDGLDLNVVGEE